MPSQTRFSRALVGGTAAIALAAAGLLATAAPANAGVVVVLEATTDSQTDWVIPVGVSSVDYLVVGGAGGNGNGEHGGQGGSPLSIAGTLDVVGGSTTINAWAGLAGQDGGGTGGAAGAGGQGYRDGGNGGTGGNSARPGGGGGGSSALAVDGAAPVVIAAGGGGGGGRGLDDGILTDACVGGNGGNAGFAGANSGGPGFKCSTQNGGVAGANTAANGDNGVNQPFPVTVNRFLGGAGGGGAGAGDNGTNLGLAILRTAGGGGGGGGASLVPAGAESAIDDTATNGFVRITYVISYVTTTTLAGPTNPVIGETVFYTATVDNTTTDDDPTGTVDFGLPGCDAVALADTVPDDGFAIATCEWDATPVGAQTLSAAYTPEVGSAFEPSGDDLDITVEKGDTTTVLQLVDDPSIVGVDVTATATVTIDAPADAPLTGSVQFIQDGVDIGAPVPLDGLGQASVTFGPGPVDVYSIEARYLGTAELNGSADVENLDVLKADTTTTLVLEPSEAVTGKTVTATATIAVVAPGDAPITGWVDFYRGLEFLGSGAVVDGKATLEFPSGMVGTYEITAVYSGNDNLWDSEDAAELVVKPAPLANTGFDAGGLTLPIAGGLVLLLLGGVAVVAHRRARHA